MERQRPQIDKAILRKKQETQRYNPTRLQTILQSYSNQKSGIGTKTDT